MVAIVDIQNEIIDLQTSILYIFKIGSDLMIVYVLTPLFSSDVIVSNEYPIFFAREFSSIVLELETISGSILLLVHLTLYLLFVLDNH